MSREKLYKCFRFLGMDEERAAAMSNLFCIILDFPEQEQAAAVQYAIKIMKETEL